VSGAAAPGEAGAGDAERLWVVWLWLRVPVVALGAVAVATRERRAAYSGAIGIGATGGTAAIVPVRRDGRWRERWAAEGEALLSRERRPVLAAVDRENTKLLLL
jgi:hypothetical protein